MKKLVTILASALLCLGLGTTVLASPQTYTLGVRDRNVDPPLGTSYSVSYLNTCTGLLNITRTFSTQAAILTDNGNQTLYSGWASRTMPTMSANDMVNVYISTSINSNSTNPRSSTHYYRVTDGIRTDTKTSARSGPCDTWYTLSLPY